MPDPIENTSELLLRQIHPNFIDADGIPATDRFRPYSGDNNKMSVDMSSKTTPEESHARYASLGRRSGGVFGLSVGEFADEAIDCFEDPIEETGKENPAHAFADYGQHELGAQKLISKRLHRLACARGILFGPIQE